MRILFISENYPPETNAAATRVYERAVFWVRWGHQVTVLTTAPNFPQGKLFDGYRNRWFQREFVDGIEIIRVKSFIAANEGVPIGLRHLKRGLRRELQHGCKLSFREACQQDSMTIREFNRIVMRAGGLLVDLPEDRGGIPHAPPRPAEEAAVCDKNSVRESNFSSWQKADRCFQAFGCGEAPRSGSEVMGDKLVTNGSGAGFYVL